MVRGKRLLAQIACGIDNTVLYSTGVSTNATQKLFKVDSADGMLYLLAVVRNININWLFWIKRDILDFDDSVDLRNR